MSSAPPPPNPPSGDDEKPPVAADTTDPNPKPVDAMDVQEPETPKAPPADTFEDIPAEIMGAATDEILTRIRLIDNDIKVRERVFGVSLWVNPGLNWRVIGHEV